MKKRWLNIVVGLLGGPFLWLQMMRHHVGRPYSIQEHITAVAVSIVTFYLLVWILRGFGMQLASFASFGSIVPADSWRRSGYVTVAILAVQLGVVSSLGLVPATAAAIATMGIGYGALVLWLGRGARRLWVAAVLVLGFAFVAAIAADEMSHHGRKRPHQQSEAVRTDPVAGVKHARLQLPTGGENTC